MSVENDGPFAIISTIVRIRDFRYFLSEFRYRGFPRLRLS